MSSDKRKRVSGVGIFVQNPSMHKVHITSISLLTSGHKVSIKDKFEFILKYRRWPRRFGWVDNILSNHGINHECPVVLDPGASHHIFISDHKLEEILKDSFNRKIIAIVQYALWRNEYSSIFEYPKP